METYTKKFILEKEGRAYGFRSLFNGEHNSTGSNGLTHQEEIYIGIAHRYDGILGHIKVRMNSQRSFLKLITVPFKKKRLKDEFGENYLVITVTLPVELKYEEQQKQEIQR